MDENTLHFVHVPFWMIVLCFWKSCRLLACNLQVVNNVSTQQSASDYHLWSTNTKAVTEGKCLSLGKSNERSATSLATSTGSVWTKIKGRTRQRQMGSVPSSKKPSRRTVLPSGWRILWESTSISSSKRRWKQDMIRLKTRTTAVLNDPCAISFFCK